MRCSFLSPTVTHDAAQPKPILTLSNIWTGFRSCILTHGHWISRVFRTIRCREFSTIDFGTILLAANRNVMIRSMMDDWVMDSNDGMFECYGETDRRMMTDRRITIGRIIPFELSSMAFGRYSWGKRAGEFTRFGAWIRSVSGRGWFRCHYHHSPEVVIPNWCSNSKTYRNANFCLKSGMQYRLKYKHESLCNWSSAKWRLFSEPFWIIRTRSGSEISWIFGSCKRIRFYL